MKFGLNSDSLLSMLIIGVTVGLSVACVFIAASWAQDPGDILGFFGGAIGAGWAVIGAVSIEDRKRARKREDTKKLFVDALKAVGVTADRFGQLPDTAVAAGILTFLQGVETFQVVCARATIDDVTGFFSMSSVIYWARSFDAEARGLLEQLNTGLFQPAQVRAVLGPKLKSFSGIIRNTLTVAYWPPESVAEYDKLMETPMKVDPITGAVSHD